MQYHPKVKDSLSIVIKCEKMITPGAYEKIAGKAGNPYQWRNLFFETF